MASTLKEGLAKKRPLIGTVCQVPSPFLIDAAGYAGMDYVVIDNEHGAIPIDGLADYVRAAEATGIIPLVRVAQNDPQLIGKALDVGAAGVVIPQIDGVEAARAAVAAAKFAPLGHRGACPCVRAAEYGGIAASRFYAQDNERTAVVLLVEGSQGIAQLDEILAVSGVDALLVGPVDLSHALQLPGQENHPIVRGKLRGMVERAKTRGIAVGVWSADVTGAQEWASLGVQILAISTDGMIFFDACHRIVSSIRGG